MIQKLRSSFEMTLFLIQVQWKERIVTSSFWIGITFQTLVLCLAIFDASENATTAMMLAIRSSLFTTITISLFASMSNINNEFRFGTIQYVLLSRVSLLKLVGVRSFCNTFISFPAVLLPFLTVAFKFPALFTAQSVAVMGLIYLYLMLVCFQSTFAINAYKNPLMALPWLSYAYIILGLNLLPFDFCNTVALAFPSAWLLLIYESDRTLLSVLPGFFLSGCALFVVTLAVFYRKVDSKIEKHLLEGRLAL